MTDKTNPAPSAKHSNAADKSLNGKPVEVADFRNPPLVSPMDYMQHANPDYDALYKLIFYKQAEELVLQLTEMAVRSDLWLTIEAEEKHSLLQFSHQLHRFCSLMRSAMVQADAKARGVHDYPFDPQAFYTAFRWWERMDMERKTPEKANRLYELAVRCIMWNTKRNREDFFLLVSTIVETAYAIDDIEDFVNNFNREGQR
jgi:hypothetical protein